MRGRVFFPAVRLSTLSWAIAALILGMLALTLLRSGVLITRDMVVIDTPALSADALGVGDLAARNAPQDGLLALAGQILPASWLARFLILGSAGLAAWAAWGYGPLGVGLSLCNPFVIERLAQGQWSLVIAAWLLPGIAASAHRPLRQLSLVWLASLTPTGAVVAGVVAIITRPALSSVVGAAVVSLPWLVPSLLSPPSSTAGAAFATRAETTLGPEALNMGATVLGLGGIWNAEVARSGGVIAGVLLFAVLLCGVRSTPRRLVVLGAAGLIAAALSLDLQAVPGGALFRDSHKYVLFALPAYAAMAAGIRWAWLRITGVVLLALSVPQAPQQLAELRPVPADSVWQELQDEARGVDVLLVGPPTAITTYQGRVAVDPRTKAVSAVQPGGLVVDGELVDPVQPRWQQAMAAWERRDDTALARLGVGLVADGDTRHHVPGVQPRPRGYGLVLLMAWLLVPLMLGLRALAARRRQHQ
ncbi:hypothetical protein CCICO_01000 [Corynebacterium ciconiae DSM 44920]|uniref:hypothetical protein n=1 Tax=Corynebacterium ciconiae TaxID=227319 RepID=UPI0003676B30|nr:hypothetical protein [Corynebacterium ciconiae]WKD60258.1 hypothetical protein CCICO_01000 [Corynebacterium ciconiae DSM 44920]